MWTKTAFLGLLLSKIPIQNRRQDMHYDGKTIWNIMEKDTLNIKTLENLKIYSKNKIPGIIFAKALCTIGIVIFHYFCHSNGNFKFLFKTSNSTFGFMLSTSFF